MPDLAPLRGIFPIIYTAFHADGRIDEPGQRRIVDYLIEAGTHGLAATGGASESAKLSPAERMSLLELCAGQAAGRVPLIMGCTADSTAQAIEFARHGARHGIRAAFSLLPKDQQQLKGDAQRDALLHYYLELGQASEIPIMVQEVSNPIPPELVAEVHRRCPNVCYVKEEAPDTGHRTTALLEATGGQVTILTGGNNLLDDLGRGAVGAIPGSIGVSDLSAAYNFHVAGDRAAARRAFNHFLPLSHWRRQFGLIGAKEVLRRLGVIAEAHLRPPAEQRLDAHDLRELDEIMALQGPPY